MANNFNKKDDVLSANDALDINELASLNDDFSVDFLDQLQNQIAQSANIANDGAMFEETTENTNEDAVVKPKSDVPSRINLSDSFDDNFIKKYKAKLNKQEALKETAEPVQVAPPPPPPPPPVAEVPPVVEESVVKKSKKEVAPVKTDANDIEKLSSGNISEKPIEKEVLDYNESLDFLDGNVKYSKYVIYVDPENTEFIESLTVKERKNLINKILREPDGILTTKSRFRMF